MTRAEVRVWLQTWQCGCGAPEDATRLVFDVLRTISERWTSTKHLSILTPADRPALDAAWKAQAAAMKALLPTSKIEYFVLYMLDHWDLTEHGGSVGGCWLTDKGKTLLAALTIESADDFSALHAGNCCIHGFSDDEACVECNPADANATNGQHD